MENQYISSILAWCLPYANAMTNENYETETILSNQIWNTSKVKNENILVTWK